MATVFPSLDSPAFVAAFDAVCDEIAALAALYDQRGVHRRDTDGVDTALAADVDAVLTATNDLYHRYETIEAYIYAFVSTEANNETAQARASTLRTRAVTLTQLDTRLQAWLGTMDATALTALSDQAREHAHTVRQAAIMARHQMGSAEEDLAAALDPSSGGAWEKLHNDVTAGLQVALTVHGEAQRLPMSKVRALAFDADPAVRRAAYAAEIAAWESVETPLAAALNGIKGQVAVLNGRRGWADSIASSLRQNGIDAPTLAAMHQAVVEVLPAFRRYLRAKARLLGHLQLPWSDLFAPVGEAPRRWSFAEARDYIVAEFDAYGPRLGGLARRAFDERWIDAEPRVGKIGGAYCMSLRRDESRIMANYDGAFDGVTTLAHELGHAYHNLCLAERTYLQRVTPMTLAETASIFCELLIEAAALARSQGAERLGALDTSLQGACQVVVDIHSRFLFEQHVFARRQERELSPAELSAAMLDAQAATYGDGLDQAARHPYMWAVKGHYYSTGVSYYNYPYTFGQLFGMGLFARHQVDANGTAAMFDDLLSSTGLADAVTLSARFGIDLHQPDFWRSSLDVLRGRIDEFAALSSV
ncbi:MAG: M3 family oligoendopeptidase [Chloroflexi bacterium]|nr:M3 family oligoendopeptidase [Chloroflexota bacterium]